MRAATGRRLLRWTSCPQLVKLEPLVSGRSRFIALLLALIVILGLGPVSAIAVSPGSRDPVVAGRSVTGPWTGSVTIWRSSAFSSQATTTWCTAASAQIMLNLVLGRSRSDATEQGSIITFSQANDSLVVSKGSDPQGWAASIRQFGTSRTATYHWERYNSFAGALKAAAYDLRMTGKPVGLLVHGGTHANVLVGFSATSDPAAGGAFTVTSAQIAGPWYPRPRIDPAPGTWLSSKTLASRFSRYTERDGLTAWIGNWVIVAP
jgi:hypothetical protein